MYDDSEHNCTECRKHYALETLDDRTTPVYLTSASGFELDRIQAALEDGGIPSTSQAQEKALSADAVTGSDKSNRDILVPFNALDKARDVCIGIGAIKPEGEEIKVEGQDVEDAVNSEIDESEIMSPAKRTAVKIIFGSHGHNSFFRGVGNGHAVGQIDDHLVPRLAITP